MHRHLSVCVALALAVLVTGKRDPATQLIGMDSEAILYSPFNWAVDGTVAKTINPGAYFRVFFSGQTAILNTNTTNSKGPYSQFWTRVDGGPLQQHILNPGNPKFPVPLGPPCASSSTHLLEVIIKSTSETIDRWNMQNTAVVFTSIEIEQSATLSAPSRKPKTVLIYGDSITEGVLTLGVGFQNDTDRNDALRDYSYQLCQTLPCEIGIVAFGATGLTKGGSGSVPALTESWNQLWSGKPRDFTDSPDLVIYNEGTNDHPDVTEDFIKVVNDVFSVAPNTKQLLLRPFNGAHTDPTDPQIQNVVKHFSPKNVFYGNTTGFYSGADGLHPFGYNHVGNIAPKMAKLVFPFLL